MKEFAFASGYENANTVRYWCSGKTRKTNISKITNALFGDDPKTDEYRAWRQELEEAYSRGQSRHLVKRPDLAEDRLAASKVTLSTRGENPDQGVETAAAQGQGAEHVLAEQARPLPDVPVVTRHFQGRNKLKEIRSILLKADADLPSVALYGLPGVGKTTLAAEYWHVYKDEYRAVGWINAQTDLSALKGLIAFGEKLGWRLENATDVQAAEHVLTRLHADGGQFLLIYDNAISAKQVKPFLPSSCGIHVIITSNARTWLHLAAKMEVEVWSDAVGGGYLVDRLERSGQRAAAEELSRTLGGLPLALEQAASLCEAQELDLMEYQVIWSNTCINLLNDESHVAINYHTKEARDNYRTVAGTFGLALDFASKVAGAEALIVLASFLAEDAIPLFLFEEAFGQLGEFATIFAGNGVHHAVEALLTVSLVKVERIADIRNPASTTKCIRLHRLVREIAAGRWSAEKRENFEHNLIDALAYAYRSEAKKDPNGWPRLRLLDSHTRSIVNNRPNPAIERNNKVKDLLNLLAEYQHEVEGKYEESIRLLQNGHLYSEDNTDEAFLVIIRLYFDARGKPVTKESDGKLESQIAGAVKKQETAFLAGGFRKILDKSPPRKWIYMTLMTTDQSKYVLTTTPLLATLTDHLGFNYGGSTIKDARVEFSHLLKLRIELLGMDHPETGTTFHGIGLLRMVEGHYFKAEHWFCRALKIWRAKLGIRHRRCARALASLADAKMRQGQFARAEKLARFAFSIRDKIADGHLDRAHSQWLLAHIWLAQNKNRDIAVSWAQSAKATLEAHLPPDHVWVRAARLTLEDAGAGPREAGRN
jgi:hypothetical protein